MPIKKERTAYACRICLIEFDTEEEAIDCESRKPAGGQFQVGDKFSDMGDVLVYLGGRRTEWLSLNLRSTYRRIKSIDDVRIYQVVNKKIRRRGPTKGPGYWRHAFTYSLASSGGGRLVAGITKLRYSLHLKPHLKPDERQEMAKQVLQYRRLGGRLPGELEVEKVIDQLLSRATQ